MDITKKDIKTWMKNYRDSQNFIEQCPVEVRAFLEPTVNMAGDFICDICYEKGLDPMKVEDE